MEDHELVARLETARFILGQPAIREGGVVLYRINDVFMFEEDAVDLANGNATIEQIIKRNKGKVFPSASTPVNLCRGGINLNPLVPYVPKQAYEQNDLKNISKNSLISRLTRSIIVAFASLQRRLTRRVASES